MGDRCYLSGHVRRSDWARFAKTLDLDDNNRDESLDEDKPNSFAFVVEEANYGCCEQLGRAALDHLVFVAYNEPGRTYGLGAAFSAGDGHFHTVDTDRELHILVPLQLHEPAVRPDTMEQMVRAWRAQQRCYDIFKQDPAGSEPAEGPRETDHEG